MSPRASCAKSVRPTLTLASSRRAHSWSAVYLRSWGRPFLTAPSAATAFRQRFGDRSHSPNTAPPSSAGSDPGRASRSGRTLREDPFDVVAVRSTRCSASALVLASAWTWVTGPPDRAARGSSRRRRSSSHHRARADRPGPPARPGCASQGPSARKGSARSRRTMWAVGRPPTSRDNTSFSEASRERRRTRLATASKAGRNRGNTKPPEVFAAKRTRGMPAASSNWRGRELGPHHLRPLGGAERLHVQAGVHRDSDHTLRARPSTQAGRARAGPRRPRGRSPCHPQGSAAPRRGPASPRDWHPRTGRDRPAGRRARPGRSR